MMPLAPLARIVRQNLRRNFRHFVLSAFGIVVGIAAFVFFLGLSGGVRKVVLGDIFPIQRVEVIAPKTTLLGVSPKLDDDLVARITARAEVNRAFPKMKMAFPAKGKGRLRAEDPEIGFEVGGFCDGIDPTLVAADSFADAFKDWEDLEKEGRAACGPAPQNACPQDHYCHWDRTCRHRVPVLLSRTLVEIYNGSFAPAHGLPRIGAAQEAVLKNFLKAKKFTIFLAESHLAGTTGNLKASPIQVEGYLVGISDKAMPIGMTVPIGYVRRWNEMYVGEAAAREYSSIIVDMKDKDEVAGFVSWVKKAGYETEDSLAERFALVITIVTLLFLVISFVIIGMSAVNISHTFYMLISERRREIGILRAVGAARGDVRKIILAEAALIGLSGGAFGIAIAVGAARGIDYLSAGYVVDFPFKPTTYFEFTPALLLGALGFAVAFCVVGAFFPARRAAQMQPAQALAA